MASRITGIKVSMGIATSLLLGGCNSLIGPYMSEDPKVTVSRDMKAIPGTFVYSISTNPLSRTKLEFTGMVHGSQKNTIQTVYTVHERYARLRHTPMDGVFDSDDFVDEEHFVDDPKGASDKEQSEKYTLTAVKRLFREQETARAKKGDEDEKGARLESDQPEPLVPVAAPILPKTPLKWKLNAGRESTGGSVVPNIGGPGSNGAFTIVFSDQDVEWALQIPTAEFELELMIENALETRSIPRSWFLELVSGS